VLSLLCAVAAAHLYSAPSPTVRFVPDDLGNPNWVSALRAMQPIQARALAGVQAFHDFQFTDRLRESGVTFRNRSVDDAGKTYKAAHYDHGNGVAVADVDGDGRLDLYFVSQVGGNQLWRNVGRQVRGHHRVGGSRGAWPHQRHGLVCRHRQRR